jgi:dTDP-4-amino-4,6-dideoxygalactose transaminase
LIPVSYPLLPDFDRFAAIARGAWERGWLTNNGQLVQTLEVELAEFLGIPSLRLTSNGTTALKILLRVCSLPRRRKIVVTPLSFVATIDAVIWAGYQPVFVDLRPGTLELDDDEIRLVLADGDVGSVVTTHLFGTPGDDGRIAAACEAYGVPLLFDAAHTFGVETTCGPLIAAGAASAISFHATKTFGTTEGGGLVSTDRRYVEQFERMRVFGIERDVAREVGTNGKMSELHAAFGLAALERFEDARLKRQIRWRLYKQGLPHSVKLIDLEGPAIVRQNYGYAIAVFETEDCLVEARDLLHSNAIASRRYFAPALSELSFVHDARSTPVASALSRRLLALPLFSELPPEDVERICRLISTVS